MDWIYFILLALNLMGLFIQSNPVPDFDQQIKAVQAVGFPIVIALLMFGFLAIIVNALIAQIINKLDSISKAQIEAIQSASSLQVVSSDRQADTNLALTRALNELTKEASANREAIHMMMMFQSKTTERIVETGVKVDMVKEQMRQPHTIEIPIPPPGIEITPKDNGK